ncbi:MAG: flagellar motor switch phosphatase FliY [Lachnospiraceae bacterium]|nr:flagellar motor switch phosphatase FliY [Lachnospiraceae bacterium]
MDGMLSQDEINSLLSGMAADDGGGGEPSPSDAPVESSGEGGEELLSEIERDAVGEVANISMGTSATTLYSLVNRKVNITTPSVEVCTWDTLIQDYEKPCVFVQIHYKVGLDGSNILVLKENDVKVITDLMMGGDGTNTDGELGELHLSAISEAMNQMMGSAATSLSSMLGKMIDISPPEASLVDLGEFGQPGDIAAFLEGEFVKISFDLQIGEDLVDSSIMQLYPIPFAKELYNFFIGEGGAADSAAPAPEPEPAPAPAPAPEPQAMPQQPAAQPMPQGMDPGMQMGMNPQMGMGMNPQMGMAPQMQMGMNPQMGMGMGMPMMQPMQPVNVQQANFQTFSGDINPLQSQENIELIKDVPLEVTVELGRTHKSINEILDFAPGTIIELEKIAGEPIDVLVNGKYVAKGEVVVIEESFGVRVTEIVK